MKKSILPAFLLLAMPLLCLPFFAFKTFPGGDVLQIYLNGKQIHQQFVHADKSAKTLHLSAFAANDKIEVLYTHCGLAGKNRVLTLQNEKGETLKEFRFGDAGSRLGFYRREVGAVKSGRLTLYYASKELPAGKLLATLDWNGGENVAKR